MKPVATAQQPWVAPPVDCGACVYVVDDDDAVRASLVAVLECAGLPVRSYAGGAEFLAACPENARGCVLLDLTMPAPDGLAVQRALAARGIGLPVLFLTAHGDIATAVRAVQAGAFDFLTKPAEGRLLLERVQAALALDARQGRERAAAAATRARFETLSRREREVLAAAVTGASSKAIARQLGISYRTVEAHRANLMRKLGAESVLALAAMALSCGVSPPAPPAQVPRLRPTPAANP